MLDGSLPAAVQCLDRATRCAEDRALARMQAGAVLIDAGHHGKALSVLQQACSEAPDAAWGWYLSGCAQIELGMGVAARTSFAQARDLAPDVAAYREEALPKGKVGWMRRFLGGGRR